MKEIRIVLNNNQETFRDEHFSIYIDDKKLENVEKFTLKAVKSIPNETGFLDIDKIIRYTVEFSAPYFEEPESNNDFQTKITQQTETLFRK